MTSRCAFCGGEGAEPTMTTIDGGYGSVTVTISGVPATVCSSCGEIGIRGPIAEAIDRAITDILVATKDVTPTSQADESSDADDDARTTAAAAERAGLIVPR